MAAPQINIINRTPDNPRIAVYQHPAPPGAKSRIAGRIASPPPGGQIEVELPDGESSPPGLPPQAADTDRRSFFAAVVAATAQEGHPLGTDDLPRTEIQVEGGESLVVTGSNQAGFKLARLA